MNGRYITGYWPCWACVSCDTSLGDSPCMGCEDRGPLQDECSLKNHFSPIPVAEILQRKLRLRHAKPSPEFILRLCTASALYHQPTEGGITHENSAAQ